MAETEHSVDMRLLLTGASSVIEEYALSPAFNWERDQEILRAITQGAEKLMWIMDRLKEGRPLQ